MDGELGHAALIYINVTFWLLTIVLPFLLFLFLANPRHARPVSSG
jgi:hypothetical protein